MSALAIDGHIIQDGYFDNGDDGPDEYWTNCITCDPHGENIMLVEIDPLSSRGHIFVMGTLLARHMDMSFQTFTNKVLELTSGV